MTEGTAEADGHAIVGLEHPREATIPLLFEAGDWSDGVRNAGCYCSSTSVVSIKEGDDGIETS